jgi:hypothetical protein
LKKHIYSEKQTPGVVSARLLAMLLCYPNASLFRSNHAWNDATKMKIERKNAVLSREIMPLVYK